MNALAEKLVKDINPDRNTSEKVLVVVKEFPEDKLSNPWIRKSAMFWTGLKEII